jgi:uncharacterized protein (DUF1684 family)
MALSNHSFPSILLMLCIFSLCCCEPSEQKNDQSAYIQEIKAWQESRNEEMRDTSSSWLNLVGLHWLEEGESTFGSDSSNMLLFPKHSPAFAGTFRLKDSVLHLQAAEGVSILHQGQTVEEMVLQHDMDTATTYLQMGSINFYAISRPEGMAIRVKDSQNPDLVNFKDIPNFDIQADWRLEAQLEWFDIPKSIMIPTVLGSQRLQECPAIIVFEVNGERYELYPYASYYGDPVWTVIFSDFTNGETTYGGGRFLELDAPQAGTPSMVVDFNKAYNPPCAFSAFATCPIPPPENRLALAIPAGEKNYGEMHYRH